MRMRTFSIVVGLLFLLFTVRVPASQGQVAKEGEYPSCLAGQWTVPDTLMLGPTAGLLESPELTSATDRLYLTANTVSNPLRIKSKWAVDHISGYYRLSESLWMGYFPGPTLMAHPPGDFIFVEPEVRVGPDEDLHLVWAEPNPDSLAQFQKKNTAAHPPRPRRVYYARYDGTRWTNPELVFQSRNRFGIQWDSDFKPAFQISPEGRAHLIFTRMPFGTFIHSRREPEQGEWTVDTLHFSGSQRALAVGGNGTLVLAHMNEKEKGGPSGMDNLYIARSTNGGRTWKRSPVSSSKRDTTGRIYYVELVGRPDNGLHLLWGSQKGTKMFRVSRIQHARSTDGGRTWSLAQGVDVPRGMLDHLQAVRSHCGQIHVLVDTALATAPGAEGPPKLRLYYTRWDRRKGWSGVRLFTPDSMQAVGATLAVWKSQLWLVYSVYPASESDDSVSIFRRVRPLSAGE